MFYAAWGLDTATANISCCSGAPPEGGNCAAEAHIDLIVAHSFNICNSFSPWLKPTRNPPNRSPSRAAACGGFYSVNQCVQMLV
jgi:hypothetical protein